MIDILIVVDLYMAYTIYFGLFKKKKKRFNSRVPSR